MDLPEEGPRATSSSREGESKKKRKLTLSVFGARKPGIPFWKSKLGYGRSLWTDLRDPTTEVVADRDEEDGRVRRRELMAEGRKGEEERD